MHFEFRVSVAACLKSQRFKLVLTRCQGHSINQHVPPDVTCCVFRAINPDKGALTVVSVHPEVKSAAEA